MKKVWICLFFLLLRYGLIRFGDKAHLPGGDNQSRRKTLKSKSSKRGMISIKRSYPWYTTVVMATVYLVPLNELQDSQHEDHQNRIYTTKDSENKYYLVLFLHIFFNPWRYFIVSARSIIIYKSKKKSM